MTDSNSDTTSAQPEVTSTSSSHAPSTQPDVMLTAPFRTTSGDYFAILLSEWLPRYGWTLFIPILATAGYGCLLHDERWLLVALMLLFIVAPMLMSFLYTYYMLTPEARRAILCKRVEIHPGHHLRLIYVSPDELLDTEQNVATSTDSDATNDEKVPENKAFIKDNKVSGKDKSSDKIDDKIFIKDYSPLNSYGIDYNSPLPQPETIAWSDVARIRRTSRFIIYFLRGSRLHFLLIPRTAMV